MQLAKTAILHESALERISQLQSKRKDISNPFEKRVIGETIQEIKEGKPFPQAHGQRREDEVHYLSRRCWELTESIYVLQIKNATKPEPNFEIEIERLKSHLETARTLLGKPDIDVTVNNRLTFVLVA